MSIKIVVPALGESVTEATIAKWRKQVGEVVQMDEILLEVETDKVTLEVNSPVDGIVTEIIAPEGSNVKVHDLVGIVEEKDISATTVGADKVQQSESAQKEAPSIAPPKSEVVAAPSAHKIAIEHGIDLSSIHGTGRDNRITKTDVLQKIDCSNHQSVAVVGSDLTRENRVKMTRLRKTIAARLKESQNTAAILTTFNEVDMSYVMNVRQIYQERFQKKHGVKLGFMSFFVKASIQALREIPAVNAEISGDDIIYKNYYDIGVAVGTENGLVVPIVRDADALSFAAIEKAIGALGLKAKEGKLSMSDMTGGSFSITNGGIYGSMLSTPIINPPQSAILGMHNIVERPIVVKGEIVVRPVMYLALSYDHRIIDGREAVTFLVRIKEMIERPERILLDI